MKEASREEEKIQSCTPEEPSRHNNLAAQHDRVCVPAITNSVLRDAFIKQLSSASPAKKIYAVVPHPRSKVI